MTSPGSASVSAVANSASFVTRTIVAPAATGATSATPTARPETAVFIQNFKIGDRNRAGPPQERLSTADYTTVSRHELRETLFPVGITANALSTQSRPSARG